MKGTTRERTRAIRDKIERAVRAMTLRPAVAQGTAVTTARLGEGLRCDVEEGPWSFRADMGEKAGGDGTGPNPGVYGRAALATCLAIGYAMWASRRDVSFDRLEVEVHADYDARGDYGVGDVEPGYPHIRIVVTVATDAAEAEVTDILDEADRNSTYYRIFERGSRLEREVRFVEAPR